MSVESSVLQGKLNVAMSNAVLGENKLLISAPGTRSTLFQGRVFWIHVMKLQHVSHTQ